MLKVVCTYKSPVSNVTKYNVIRVFKKFTCTSSFPLPPAAAIHSLQTLHMTMWMSLKGAMDR